MAIYIAVSESEKDADSIVDVSLIDKLDQNPHAIAEGASGAPKIQSAALDSDIVTAAKIAANAVGQSEIASGAVHQSELDTSSGIVSVSDGAADLTLPGGQYGFYPQLRADNGDITISLDARLANDVDSATYAANIYLSVSGSSTPDGYARQRYVNSSPPIDLGDGDIPLFFFAMMRGGKMFATYAADVPPWLYNGPTNTRPDEVLKSGKKLQWRRTIDPTTKRVTKEKIEITQAIKNADMGIIPHPFPKSSKNDSIVLLDPPSTDELLDLHEAGEEVHKLIKDDYIRIGNERLQRCGPDGVMPVSFKWRLTR